MSGVRVDFKLLTGPDTLAAMDAVVKRLDAMPGLGGVTSFGVGEAGWFSFAFTGYVDAHVIFGHLSPSTVNIEFAKASVRAANGIGAIGAAVDTASSASGVVTQSAADGAAAVQTAGAAAADAAHGVGIGVGVGLVVLAVAALLLYVPKVRGA